MLSCSRDLPTMLFWNITILRGVLQATAAEENQKAMLAKGLHLRLCDLRYKNFHLLKLLSYQI